MEVSLSVFAGIVLSLVLENSSDAAAWWDKIPKGRKVLVLLVAYPVIAFAARMAACYGFSLVSDAVCLNIQDTVFESINNGLTAFTSGTIAYIVDKQSKK